jgi:pantetheine-phosphate adenylyltransferase
MVTAVYPGTFDPLTNGHMDIIERGLKLFDILIIAVADNKNKQPLFSLQERIELIQSSLINCKKLSNIRVTGFDNLLIEFCQQHQAKVILRGLRAVSDFEYEFQLAGMNKKLNPAIETLFLPTTEQNAYISSSLVKEVARLGGDVEKFIPAYVKAELFKKLG